MKERILTLIRRNELTALRFAEIIEVQPSNISHILSGRNKPSFDFIEKILTKFPEVSSDWLILGRGEMLRSDNKVEITPEPEVKEVALPQEDEVIPAENELSLIEIDSIITNVNKPDNQEDTLQQKHIVTNVNHRNNIKIEQNNAVSPRYFEQTSAAPVTNVVVETERRAVETAVIQPIQPTTPLYTQQHQQHLQQQQVVDKEQQQQYISPTESVQSSAPKPKDDKVKEPEIEKIVFFYKDGTFKVYNG